MRRNPPAEVSPLTPAFTTSKFQPAWSIFFCSSAGKASFPSNPNPAAMLSPSTRIVLADFVKGERSDAMDENAERTTSARVTAICRQWICKAYLHGQNIVIERGNFAAAS